jgi:hypothetical protein
MKLALKRLMVLPQSALTIWDLQVSQILILTGMIAVPEHGMTLVRMD